MKTINCVGYYSISPHDSYGNIGGFTITLETSMPFPEWWHLPNLEIHHLTVNSPVFSFECDAYIKAYKVETYTNFITEVTLATSGKVVSI